MEPRVESYRFGEMVISGKTYRRDLKIINGKVVPDWWRKEGHSLCLEDIRDILEAGCEVLVIGTGAYGVMKVPEPVRKALESKGLRVEILPTAKAAELFNSLVKEGKRVAGAFHLTC